MALQATTGLSVLGVPSQAVLQGLSALTRPMTQQQQYLPTSSQEPSASSTSTHQGLGPSPGKLQMQMELPDDVALKMAIDASLRTATEEGLQLSAAGELTNVQDRRHGESSDSRTRMYHQRMLLLSLVDGQLMKSSSLVIMAGPLPMKKLDQAGFRISLENSPNTLTQNPK